MPKENPVETFIRQTLCSHKLDSSADERPIHEFLPPLTSSNDLDIQLYAIIAIILKDHVQSWYGGITGDHIFVDEVIQIIAHCTRALEQRVRKVNLEELLLDEVPHILDAHIKCWRISQRAALSPTALQNPYEIYHTLRPHPALSPYPESHSSDASSRQGQNDADYRRLLSQGLLAVLLPTDDLQNPCLFALVFEILADLILGNILAGRICEASFLYSAIAKGAETLHQRMRLRKWIQDVPNEPPRRLDRYGLLTAEDKRSGLRSSEQDPNSISNLSRHLMQWMLTGVMVVKTLFSLIASSTSLPRRLSVGLEQQDHDSELRSQPQRYLKQSQLPHQLPDRRGFEIRNHLPRKPVVSLHVFPTITNLLRLDEKMPWLSGAGSLMRKMTLETPATVGAADCFIDR
ncbi:MAG: hypothetical protein M1831_000273 [Alyxoria varia]|nr:MAG: hypothetical protein M1831_000273 [Alyxoria varia]